MGRIIGITHRVKQTAEGEARPTLVCILGQNGKTVNYKLETETDELDFVLNRFPIKYREATESEDLSAFRAHQLKTKKKDAGKVTLVPEAFDGLKVGDLVAMPLGGSGDRLAYAIARQGEKQDFNIIRLTTKTLSERRGDASKDDDAELLAKLASNEPDIFQPIKPRDLELIKLREAWFNRQEAMKERIACEQRIRSRLIGRIFLSDEGGYPEGNLEDLYDAAKANDVILQALEKEEKARNKKLFRIVADFHVWQEIFQPLEGVGETIAARIIAAIGDIRRFPTEAKFKAYCGVHVLSDGRFPRRRGGEVANWSDARQALYLLADQWNRRPNSVWGQKLREYKIKLRAAHPEPVRGKNDKLKYTNAHIHKMAQWRTMTKFAEWLYREWTQLEEALDIKDDDQANPAA